MVDNFDGEYQAMRHFVKHNYKNIGFVTIDSTQMQNTRPVEWLSPCCNRKRAYCVAQRGKILKTLPASTSQIPRKRKKSMPAIYSDDDAVPTKTKVGIQKKIVLATNLPDIKLKPSGGQAIRGEITNAGLNVLPFKDGIAEEYLSTRWFVHRSGATATIGRWHDAGY